MNEQTSLISNIHKYWKQDFLASIVVFLVALPLSMGIAVASGVPIEKAASVGLITAIIGGLIDRNRRGFHAAPCAAVRLTTHRLE